MKTIKVKDGQSIYDIAVQEYGELDAVWFLIDDNRLDMEKDLVPGRVLNIRDGYKPNKVLTFRPTTSKATQPVLIVKDNQSLYDIAVQQYGDLSGILLLIEDNGLDMQSQISPGQILKVRDIVLNEQALYFKATGRAIANGYAPEKGELTEVLFGSTSIFWNNISITFN